MSRDTAADNSSSLKNAGAETTARPISPPACNGRARSPGRTPRFKKMRSSSRTSARKVNLRAKNLLNRPRPPLANLGSKRCHRGSKPLPAIPDQFSPFPSQASAQGSLHQEGPVTPIGKSTQITPPARPYYPRTYTTLPYISSSTITQSPITPYSERAYGVLQALPSPTPGPASRVARLARARHTPTSRGSGTLSYEYPAAHRRDTISRRREAAVQDLAVWRRVLAMPQEEDGIDDIYVLYKSKRSTSNVPLSPRYYVPERSKTEQFWLTDTLDDSYEGPSYPDPRIDRPFWIPKTTGQAGLQPPRRPACRRKSGQALYFEEVTLRDLPNLQHGDAQASSKKSRFAGRADQFDASECTLGEEIHFPRCRDTLSLCSESGLSSTSCSDLIDPFTDHFQSQSSYDEEATVQPNFLAYLNSKDDCSSCNIHSSHLSQDTTLQGLSSQDTVTSPSSPGRKVRVWLTHSSPTTVVDARSEHHPPYENEAFHYEGVRGSCDAGDSSFSSFCSPGPLEDPFLSDDEQARKAVLRFSDESSLQRSSLPRKRSWDYARTISHGRCDPYEVGTVNSEGSSAAGQGDTQRVQPCKLLAHRPSWRPRPLILPAETEREASQAFANRRLVHFASNRTLGQGRLTASSSLSACSDMLGVDRLSSHYKEPTLTTYSYPTPSLTSSASSISSASTRRSHRDLILPALVHHRR
ncbi:unnamed protein product [Sympodiomycopsis kandeliae]